MSTKNLSYFENARKIVGINVKQVILKMLKIVGVGCEPRIGVILKMQKKLGGGWMWTKTKVGGRVDVILVELGSGSGGWIWPKNWSNCENAKKSGSGGGGCDARIEAILKMQNAKKKKKKKSGEGVYVNQEFKLFWKSKK